MAGKNESSAGPSQIGGALNKPLQHEDPLVIDEDPLVSDEGRRVVNLILYVSVNYIFALLGSAANIINIVVFVKQGFRHSVNISLCCLAVSDLGVDLTLVWRGLSYNPLIRDSNIDFDSVNDQFITAAYPHGCFSSITNGITAFLTIERCVCTHLPMKVKDIITPKRTIAVCVSIFVTFFAVAFPVIFFVRREPIFFTERNKTLLSLSITSDGCEYDRTAFFSNVFSSLSSVVVVTGCASMLIHKLHTLSRWRQRAIALPGSGNSDPLSPRDKRAVKMVTTMAAIFVMCNVPIVVNILTMLSFSPAYSQNGRYRNLFQVTWAIINTLEILNSSATILVYYNMSSKFRVTFNELFFTGRSQRHAVG